MFFANAWNRLPRSTRRKGDREVALAMFEVVYAGISEHVKAQQRGNFIIRAEKWLKDYRAKVQS